MDVKDTMDMMPFVDSSTKLGKRMDYIQLLLVDIKARQAENRTIFEDMKNALEYTVFSKVGLTKCTATPAQVTIGAVLWYTNGGARDFKVKGVNQNIAFTAGTHNIATSSVIREKVYLYQITGSGTITVTGSTSAVSGAAVWPTRTATLTAFAGVKIKVDASAQTIFTAATTTLTASQIASVTYYDFCNYDNITTIPTAITALTPADFSAYPTGLGYV